MDVTEQRECYDSSALERVCCDSLSSWMCMCIAMLMGLGLDDMRLTLDFCVFVGGNLMP